MVVAVAFVCDAGSQRLFVPVLMRFITGDIVRVDYKKLHIHVELRVSVQCSRT